MFPRTNDENAPFQTENGSLLEKIIINRKREPSYDRRECVWLLDGVLTMWPSVEQRSEIGRAGSCGRGRQKHRRLSTWNLILDWALVGGIEELGCISVRSCSYERATMATFPFGVVRIAQMVHESQSLGFVLVDWAIVCGIEELGAYLFWADKNDGSLFGNFAIRWLQ